MLEDEMPRYLGPSPTRARSRPVPLPVAILIVTALACLAFPQTGRPSASDTRAESSLEDGEEVLVSPAAESLNDRLKIGFSLVQEMTAYAFAFAEHDRNSEALEALERAEQAMVVMTFLGGCLEQSSVACGQIGEQEKRCLYLGVLIESRLGHDEAVRERLLAAVSRSDDSDSEEVDTLLKLLLSRYITRSDFESAYAVLFTVIDGAVLAGRPSLMSKVGERSGTLSLALFESVSWDFRSKKRRSDDPRDFVDDGVIGLKLSSKYGMTDPEEDHATFGTMLFVEEEAKAEPRYLEIRKIEDPAEVNLTGYLRTLMAQGKFELVAKYLIFSYIFEISHEANGTALLCPRRSPEMVAPAEVVLALDKATNVPERTATVIRLIDAVISAVEKRCGNQR
jgi:hypothetical protein